MSNNNNNSPTNFFTDDDDFFNLNTSDLLMDTESNNNGTQDASNNNGVNFSTTTGSSSFDLFATPRGNPGTPPPPSAVSQINTPPTAGTFHSGGGGGGAGKKQQSSNGLFDDFASNVFSNAASSSHQQQEPNFGPPPSQKFSEDSNTMDTEMSNSALRTETSSSGGKSGGKSGGMNGGKKSAGAGKSGGKKSTLTHTHTTPNTTTLPQRSRQGPATSQTGEPPFKRQKTSTTPAQILGASGGLQFIHVENDGSIENLKWIHRLKKVYVIQLPNMGSEYISRLIFDKTHKSVIGLNQDKQIVGGITYKPFSHLGYIEIAFVAVDASFQIRGSGRKLMNQLKRVCQKQRLFKFLTYADNQAVGFFQKCGFSTDILISGTKYKGFIKTYNGVTLMECNIAPGINYTTLNAHIEKQKKFLMERMQQIVKSGHSSTVHPPLFFDSNGAAFADASRQRRLLSYHDIPGMENVRALKRYPLVRHDNTQLAAKLRQVLESVRQDPASEIFREPVDPMLLSDYKGVITDCNSIPIDLKLIEQRLNQGFYRNERIFIADFCRMFENCRLYNAQNPPFPTYANNCEKVFFQHMVKAKLVDRECLKKYEKRGKRPKKSKS